MNRHMYFRQQEKNALMHHGIKGQKWGVRRYQNADGSYTQAGKERYGHNTKTDTSNFDSKMYLKDFKKSTYGEGKYKSTYYEKEVNGIRFSLQPDHMNEEKINKAAHNMKYVEDNIKEFDKSWSKEVQDYTLESGWLDKPEDMKCIKLESISSNYDGTLCIYYGDGYMPKDLDPKDKKTFSPWVLGGHVVDFDYSAGDEKDKNHIYDMRIEG